MPVVTVQITPGASREQRERLAKSITESLCDTLGKQPEHCHVIFQEYAEEMWGYAGMLTDEYRAMKREGAGGEQ